MELDKNAFGWALGFAEALFVFVTWIFEVFGAYEEGAEVIEKVYPGFGASVVGLIFGLIGAFVVGYVFGYLLAWVYNSCIS